MRLLTKEEKQQIRDLSKSKYDSWTNPPPIETLTNLFKRQPANFTTVSLKEIETIVIDRLKANEPLINNLSEPTMRRLVFGIDKCYYGNNIEDLDTGGNGLIIPTFMEIMHMVVFWIRDNDYKELVNESDKAFFHKYFWCFEEYSKLIVEAQLKKSA